MKEQLQKRLQELTDEYESGQKALAELGERQTRVRETLLRIAGAIQVLEEVLAEADGEENGEVSQPFESFAEMEPLRELAASRKGS